MGQPVIEQGPWRFYTDATPDSSMVALAAEDTAPTLTQTQLENGLIRLRVQICETGGSKGETAAVNVQWSPDNSNWRDIGEQTTPDGADWVFWANGAATNGNTIGSQFLTGTSTSGAYHEQSGDSETIAISDEVEIDCALRIQWPPPDSTIYLRLTWGASAMPLKSGSVVVSLTIPTPANRSYAVAQCPYQNHSAISGGTNPKAFYDGTYWWAFWVDTADLNHLNYHYWSGSGAWSSASYTAFTDDIDAGYNVAVWLEVLGSTPVVMVIWNTSAGNAQYKRGTISGTTISWGSETSLGATGTGSDTAVAVDDGGYWWIAEAIGSTGIRARRSTNADSGSSWTAGWNSTHSASDTGMSGGNLLCVIGLASDKAIVVWYSGTAIKWALVDDTSGFGTVNTLVSTANPIDWGLTRTGGYIYLVHTDTTGNSGNWVLRVFTESSDTWSSGTSPSVSGQGTTQDGLSVIASGTDDIFCVGSFTYDAYNNRKLSYKKYSGPGASGTWDSSLTDLTPDEARGNGDYLTGCPSVAGGSAVVLWTFNDADLGDYPMTYEYHVLDVGGADVTFTATIATSATTPTPSLPVAREMISTIATQTTTPSGILGVVRGLVSSIDTSTTTPTPILTIVKEFAATIATAASTPDAILGVVRAFAATAASTTSTPDAALSVLREFAATVATSTTTPNPALSVTIPLAAVVATATSTPDDAILVLVKELAALIATSTTTPDAGLLIARGLSTTIATQTTTPTPSLAVERELAALIDTQTSTPTPLLSLAISLVSTIDTSTSTPTPILNLVKLFVAAIATSTTTPSPALGVTRGMAASIDTATTTPSVPLAVTRALSALIATQTSTPSPDLDIGGVVSFVSTIATSTTTPSAALSVIRELVASIQTQTTTPTANLGVAYALAATIATQTSTPTITLDIGGLVEFVATIATSTTTPTASLGLTLGLAAAIATQVSTPDVVLGIIKSLLASIATTTQTPSPGLDMERGFAATIATTTQTPDAALSVLRQFVASIDTQTTTPDNIELLLVLAVGLMTVVLSGRAPGTSFDGRAPGTDFDGRAPSITFTGDT